ncbi:MAG: hypothetical protein KDC92_14875 [Bacteroidetes bacterium]|nr:hypothetical protein [Bacteroidota bacterium]
MIGTVLLAMWLTFSAFSHSSTVSKKDYRAPTSIHVMVALCDNENQGIIPVSKDLGNGQNPRLNLYWGAFYGVKTHFKKSANWELIYSQKLDTLILERAVFKHKTKNAFLVADAYDGRYIKQTTTDFVKANAGLLKDQLTLDSVAINLYGNADLTAYIGHDGLMEFGLDQVYKNKDGIERECIILACISKTYFEPELKHCKTNPLVWTTGLMAPEAYTLHDAIDGFLANESEPEIRLRAAQAYAKYQKCSLSAAKRLLVYE